MGLLAAYAFALQILLTGIATVQMSASMGADPFAICFGTADSNGDHKPGTPLAHQTCIVCSVTPIASAPPASGAVAALRLGRDVEFNGAAEHAAPVSRVHSPRSSQGPPQAA